MVHEWQVINHMKDKNRSEKPIFICNLETFYLQGAMSSLGLKDCYVGSQAQSLRGILSISHPIRQGVVQNWDDLETIWTHIVENELKTDSSAQPMLITQMPLASEEEETRMAEILMEKLNVPAMFIANKSVMSLYGGGNMTGISVDSGHDTTYLGDKEWNFVSFCFIKISSFSVPSYQGNAIQDASLVLKIGGKQVTEHLMNLLMNGKYSFPDDNFLLWRKKKKTKFTVSSRKEIIREMKVITIITTFIWRGSSVGNNSCVKNETEWKITELIIENVSFYLIFDF